MLLVRQKDLWMCLPLCESSVNSSVESRAMSFLKWAFPFGTFLKSTSPIEFPITGVTKMSADTEDHGPYRSDFHTANGIMAMGRVNVRLNSGLTRARAHNNGDSTTFNVQPPSYRKARDVLGRKEAKKIGALMTLGLTLGSSVQSPSSSADTYPFSSRVRRRSQHLDLIPRLQVGNLTLLEQHDLSVQDQETFRLNLDCGAYRSPNSA